MKTAADLEQAFSVYRTEMDRCEKARCFWALLHLAVVLPDVCGALELGVKAKVGKRYMDWCAANFPTSPKLTPADRYQLRCALLHEGSTLTDKSKAQYGSFTFVDPTSTDADVHLLVAADGKDITINVKTFADETWAAVRAWFAALDKDAARNAAVEKNLTRLAREQTKQSAVPILTGDGAKIMTATGTPILVTQTHLTTSSG